jgi:tRNA (guanine-N7-)-methyltransferase
MRIRQHVNPLRIEYLLAPRVRPMDLPPGEVEVELGCGEAWFLFDRARMDPARACVGVELREELVHAVNRRAAAEGARVKAVFANNNAHLSTLFGPASVGRIFINFPDPWFKRRHHKRRVMDDALVDACHRALRPGGELFFQSDIFELALEAMAMLEAKEGRFDNRAGPWSFWKAGNPFGARSRREATCEAEGRPIWRLFLGRR